ncbi:MAG: LysR family transcriptional regulator [Sphingomonadaceae bacterium]
MLDIRLLLQFAAVAEALSFSAAARKLGTSQPRLSLQIRKLESAIGMPLFNRNTRSVELTPYGRDLLELVRPLAGIATTVLEEVDLRRLGHRGRLRIGTMPLGEPDPRLASLLSSFATRQPELCITVEAGNPEILLDRLDNGQIDFAVVTDFEESPRFERLRLHDLDFAVMLNCGDPLVGRDTLHISDFSGRAVAMLAQTAVPEFFSRHYAPLIAAGACPVYVPELRRSLLRDNAGMIVTTVVPSPADATMRYGVVRRRIADASPLWLSLLQRKGATRPVASERFWSFVKSWRQDAQNFPVPDRTAPTNSS